MWRGNEKGHQIKTKRKRKKEKGMGQRCFNHCLIYVFSCFSEKKQAKWIQVWTHNSIFHKRALVHRMTRWILVNVPQSNRKKVISLFGACYGVILFMLQGTWRVNSLICHYIEMKIKIENKTKNINTASSKKLGTLNYWWNEWCFRTILQNPFFYFYVLC